MAPVLWLRGSGLVATCGTPRVKSLKKVGGLSPARCYSWLDRVDRGCQIGVIKIMHMNMSIIDLNY